MRQTLAKADITLKIVRQSEYLAWPAPDEAKDEASDGTPCTIETVGLQGARCQRHGFSVCGQHGLLHIDQ